MNARSARHGPSQYAAGPCRGRLQRPLGRACGARSSLSFFSKIYALITPFKSESSLVQLTRPKLAVSFLISLPAVSFPHTLSSNASYHNRGILTPIISPINLLFLPPYSPETSACDNACFGVLSQRMRKKGHEKAKKCC